MAKFNIKHLATFLIAVGRHILDRWRKLHGIEYWMRIDECMRCEYLDDTPKPWEHCSECGCPVREKASWRSERCPRNKWIQD